MGSPLPTGLEASPACPLTPANLGPGLDDPPIAIARARLSHDPEEPALVVFGSRACLASSPLAGQLHWHGTSARRQARPSSDLDLPLIVAGALTPERERSLRSRASVWLTPVLPVDLDLLITDADTAAHDSKRAGLSAA